MAESNGIKRDAVEVKVGERCGGYFVFFNFDFNAGEFRVNFDFESADDALDFGRLAKKVKQVGVCTEAAAVELQRRVDLAGELLGEVEVCTEETEAKLQMRRDLFEGLMGKVV